MFGFLVTIVCFKEIDGENNVGVINKNRNINENGNDNENKNENIDRG